MPLDGHSYLVSQGWKGKGSGLRDNSLSRPIAIPQKRNVRGLGKDRDEAFPFWDHLFTAASTAIQIKIADSDASDDEVGEESTKPEKTSLVLNRTVTGIISNRNPIGSTPASTSTSGSSTPLSSGNDDSSLAQGQGLEYKYSLLAQAKRQAAKQLLYAGFFRGLVLGPDTSDSDVKTMQAEPKSKKRALDDIEQDKSGKAKSKKRRVEEGDEVEKKSKCKSKKDKGKERDEGKDEGEDREAKEKRRAEKAEKKRRKEEKRARKEAATQIPTDAASPQTPIFDEEDKRAAEAKRKAERAEKRRLKEERAKAKEHPEKVARKAKKRHRES